MPDNEIMDGQSYKTVIFTLGYEGTEIEDFASKLAHPTIAALSDVRKNAISRKTGFFKNLSKKMKNIGIQYYHMPELGIASSLRKQLDDSKPETYSNLFDYYEKSILPNFTSGFCIV